MGHFSTLHQCTSFFTCASFNLACFESLTCLKMRTKMERMTMESLQVLSYDTFERVRSVAVHTDSILFVTMAPEDRFAAYNGLHQHDVV